MESLRRIQVIIEPYCSGCGGYHGNPSNQVIMEPYCSICDGYHVHDDPYQSLRISLRNREDNEIIPLDPLDRVVIRYNNIPREYTSEYFSSITPYYPDLPRDHEGLPH